MVETNFNRKALAEVYNVLIMLNKQNFEKIPIDIIQAIKNNMDTEYEVEWKEIEEGKMLEDTEKILSVLYTDYLSTPEEKDATKKLESIKYLNSYPVFKERVEKNIEEDNKLTTVKKEKWFNRMFAKIKELLKL